MVLTTFLTLGQSVAAGASGQTTLHARIISVRPALAPYNPQFASGGTPVEEVTFALRSTPPASNHFSCTILVRHRGKVVGHTQANFSGPWDFPPSADRWAVQVNVRGRTFKGSPSDATVKCET
jgi:hypothetical protein